MTLLVCERLGVNPVPFLSRRGLRSNIGGAAALVGDPRTSSSPAGPACPSTISDSHGRLSSSHWRPSSPCCRCCSGSFSVEPDRIDEIMSLNEARGHPGCATAGECAVVLTRGVRRVHRPLGDPHGTRTGRTARRRDADPDHRGGPGALPSTAWNGRRCCSSPGSSSWSAPWSRPGDRPAGSVGRRATGGNPLLAAMAILVISAGLSGIIDNIPTSRP